MSRNRSWLLWTPFMAAGLVLTAWYYVWWSAAETLRSALAGFAADQAHSGATVTYAPLRAKGFPFFLRGELGAVSYGRGEGRLEAGTKYEADREHTNIAWGGCRWEADAVHLHAMPWAPDRIVLSTSPSMRLRAPGGEWIIRTDGARASVETTASGWLFKAEAASLDGARNGASFVTGRGVINVMPDGVEPGAVAASFRLFGATLRNSRGEAKIARLDGALAIEPVARRVAVHGVDGEIGEARVQLSGVLAADSAGFAEGALAANLTNPADLVRALRVLAVIKAEDAVPLEAGLALIAAGVGGTIEAPLVFSDGETKLAGLKLGKAPRLGQP